VYLNDDLGKVLNASEKELITSITSGGAFIGAVAAGLTADRFGRKGAIYMGCTLFIIGAILQASAYSLAQMTVGRLVVGFGVGSAAMIVPLYIAEVAPAKYRGRMIGLDNMSITGGQLISYGIGAALAKVPHGWRAMVALGAVPAIILCCLLPFCPESPRQLIYHDRNDEAAVVIQKIFPQGTPEQVQQKVQHIAGHVAEAKAIMAAQAIVRCSRKSESSHCGLRPYGYQPAWWFQQLDVLLLDPLRSCWFRKSCRCRNDHCGNELFLHLGQPHAC
jgi:SP family myo-inositol transporter-like MFS transporter 13